MLTRRTVKTSGLVFLSYFLSTTVASLDRCIIIRLAIPSLYLVDVVPTNLRNVLHLSSGHCIVVQLSSYSSCLISTDKIMPPRTGSSTYSSRCFSAIFTQLYCLGLQYHPQNPVDIVKNRSSSLSFFDLSRVRVFIFTTITLPRPSFDQLHLPRFLFFPSTSRHLTRLFFVQSVDPATKGRS